MKFTVATWNTQWAVAQSVRGTRVSARLREVSADVIVVTEGSRGLLPSGGYAVDAGEDWGYPVSARRRKAIIWSRYVMSNVEVVDEGAARGRLVMAKAESPLGPVRIVGVCVPWASAHVNTGRANANPWSEHMNYLDQLDGVLQDLGDALPVIVVGDFNQRIPRVRQPLKVATRLAEVFNPLTVHTMGDLENGPLIDHIASNQLLGCQSVSTWPGTDSIGRLSDHSGVSCEFRAKYSYTSRSTVTGP